MSTPLQPEKDRFDEEPIVAAPEEHHEETQAPADIDVSERPEPVEHDTDNEIDLLRRHVTEKYRGTMREDEVSAAVDQARGEIEPTAKNKEFLPIFVMRRTEQLLCEWANDRGLDLAAVEQILFVDEDDTGLAQMAAAIANGKADGLVRARSAGVTKGDKVRDNVAEWLRERGDDPEADEVSTMTGKAALTSDVVVTMGLNDELREEMGTHGLHQVDWDDLEPVGDRSVEDLRGIAEEIERRVDEIVEALVSDQIGDREVDPEADAEIEKILDELHSGQED